jgi:hypothetical protein
MFSINRPGGSICVIRTSVYARRGDSVSKVTREKEEEEGRRGKMAGNVCVSVLKCV